MPASHVVPAWRGTEQPSVDRLVSQIIQAAVDAGIVHAAIEDTIEFVRTKSRPWIDSSQDRAAEAKILTTEIALLARNKLFELSGTRSTLAEHNLDRHWRNARTNTLHDSIRWKYHAIGQYYLNDCWTARARRAPPTR